MVVHARREACVECSVDAHGEKVEKWRLPWRCMECSFVNHAKAGFCGGRSWRSDSDLEQQVADTECMVGRGRMVQPGCAFMCDRWLCAVCGVAATDGSWGSVIMVDNAASQHTRGQRKVSRVARLLQRGVRHTLRAKEIPEGVRLFYGGVVPEYEPGGYQPPRTPVDLGSTQWRFMAGLTPAPDNNMDRFVAEFRDAQKKLEERRQLLLAERKAILAGSTASAAAASSADSGSSPVATESPPGIVEV